jgi:hypothetical protein
MALEKLDETLTDGPGRAQDSYSIFLHKERTGFEPATATCGIALQNFLHAPHAFGHTLFRVAV